MPDTPPRCELCGQPAVFRDSVPDASQGNPFTHGVWHYRTQLLCAVHGWERQKVNTSRVKQLEHSGHDR